MLTIFLHLLLSMATAFVVGTLVEYVVHRLMHARVFLYKIHAEHHQANQGQGWFLEFKDYFLPSSPVLIIGGALFWWLLSPAAGIGFAAGCFLYAAAAAYAHQVQHENPDLCFWMPRPVHHLHHNGKMWHHNFGILVDWWDRVFGTYKKVEWERERKRYPISSYFRIKWF